MSKASQTPQTRRIARKILKLKKQGETWSEISKKLGIVKKDGSPDPGLAYRIGVDGYEPRGKEIRERLGLRAVCLECMRAFRKVSKQVSARPPWLEWWYKLSKEERDRRIRRHYEEKE